MLDTAELTSKQYLRTLTFNCSKLVICHTIIVRIIVSATWFIDGQFSIGYGQSLILYGKIVKENTAILSIFFRYPVSILL